MILPCTIVKVSEKNSFSFYTTIQHYSPSTGSLLPDSSISWSSSVPGGASIHTASLNNISSSQGVLLAPTPSSAACTKPLRSTWCLSGNGSEIRFVSGLNDLLTTLPAAPRLVRTGLFNYLDHTPGSCYRWQPSSSPSLLSGRLAQFRPSLP